MRTVEEVSQVSRVHRYSLSLKSLTWATTLVIVVMAGLYALLGLPPTLETYYSKMYFHSIGIGLAALATFLVISIFDLQRHEPPLDFPISYRAFAAVLFAAAGGIFYLSPALDAFVTDIPLGLFIVAFILIADVGGALFVELLFLPRKLAGMYSSTASTGLSLGYFLRMLPSTGKDLRAYRRMNAAYWLALFSVGSAFVAGIIGFANLWVRMFGASFFASYLSSLGLDVAGFMDATLDPHSHQMALAIMAGVVALTAQRFGVSELGKIKKIVADIGLWVALIRVTAMTFVLVAVAAVNYSLPTLLQGGPQGVNGIAGDDVTMSIIAVGAMITLVPLGLTRFEKGKSWRDSVRFGLLGAWVLAVIVNVIQGFFIELHEDVFSATSVANDAVYSEFQPMFGVFVFLGAALVMLAVDYYNVSRGLRRAIGWIAGIGLLIATLGGTLWVYLDPSLGGLSYWLYIFGVQIVGVSALLATLAIRAARVERISVLVVQTP